MISEILNRKMVCPNGKCRSESIKLVLRKDPYEYWRCQDCNLTFATWLVDEMKLKK